MLGSMLFSSFAGAGSGGGGGGIGGGSACLESFSSQEEVILSTDI
jgi:hypothetical protein